MRTRLLSVLVMCLACGAALAAPVEVAETPQSVTVHNAYFTATFNRQSGGMLTDLRSASGTDLLGGWRIYTDHGLYKDGTAYSSANENQAVLGVTRTADGAVVHCTGRLLGPGSDVPAELLRYETEYTFDGSSTMRVKVVLTPAFDHAGLGGFLSQVVFIPRFTDMTVDSGQGRIIEATAATQGRSYQSGRDGLSADHPEIAFTLPDGSQLTCRIDKPSPRLSNIFVNEDGKGGAALFFAWLDGGAARDVVKGKPWQVQLALTLPPNS